jgi:hypothetical protein
MKIDISEPIIQFDKHELGLKPLGKLTNVERQYFFDSPTYVKIPDEEKNNLVTFASEHHIDLKDGWSALGNLKCIKNFVKPLLTSKDEEHVGTEDEVNKYNMILEALGRYYLIKGYKEYFMFLDNIEVLTLLLENNGTYFDEDILITLYIPKGNMIFPDDIINPDQLIIDDITKNIDTYFMPIAISNIDSFPDYQEVDKSTPSVPYVPFLDLQTSEEKYREAIEEYRTALSEIFLFETYGDDEFDIIKIHQSYLKHNEKNYLPCFFLFKNKVEYIKYTITSKNNPNVIKGELNVE